MITGRLQEKKGRYYMVLNLRGDDGKWKPKWISTGLPAVKGNKRKADNILRETINEYEADDLQMEQMKASGQQARILLVDYLAGWLKLMKQQVEGSTYVSYRRVMEKVMLPYFEPLGLYLHELEAKHVKAYYEYLQMERGNSANTVKHHHANLRKALKSAMISDLILTNPADKVEVPKIKPHVADIYNKQDLAQLFEATKGTILELPVMIAAYYGLRRSEVMGLRWDAIDFEKKTIAVNHIIVRAEDDAGNMVFEKRNRTKNKSSFRTLPLIPAIEEKLLQKKEQQAAYRRKYGKSYRTDNLQYVNTGRLGNLVTPDVVSQHFGKLLKKHGLRHIRFHDLRHSCASLLLANGVSMKQIQEWLGHSSYNTTANIYAHLDSNSKISSANAIASALGGGPVDEQQKIGA
ncbi:MAG: site-specific integrase [Ruminococcaceae bacterium]|nr:site-specific integrase [Oscillospiraceae bacterium]